jgi:signal peptidase II
MSFKTRFLTKVNLKRKTRYFLLIIALFIVLFDQITKYIVRFNFNLYEIKPFINGFWNWILIYNKGAAFSLLANEDGSWAKIMFGIIAFVVSIWILNYLLNKSYSVISGIGLSFVLGGALGNLIDRIIHGKVTDFIDWYYKSHHWPAFNIADSFILSGVILLIIDGLFFSKE